MRKAVFLDRDGTIIEDVGYIKFSKDIVLFENVFESIRILQNNYLLFIITNQSGVRKGFLTIKEVNNVNSTIKNKFLAESIKITEIFVCPHKKVDNYKCYKPKPYFLLKASKKYDIDLSKSYLIGDHPSDILCAENAGAKGIYLLTGHGKRHLHEFKKKPIIKADILQAAKYINKIKIKE